MNLIVSCELTCDEGLYFRYITMVAKTELSCVNLIEAEEKYIDSYYRKLKQHGWFDFVDDFVLPEWREEGIRIDKELNFPLTIVTPKIECSNTLSILGQIKSLNSLNLN